MATPLDAEIMTVTPQLAKDWLERNTENYRKLSNATVNRYAADMAAGAWTLTGEGIKFDTSGRLADGQHRLWACVKAGVEFQTVVIRGIKPEAILNLDNGQKRSLISHLEHQNEDYARPLGSAITVGWRFSTNKPTSTVIPTFQQALNWLDENPGMRQAVAEAEYVRRRDIRIPGASLAPVLMYARLLADADDVGLFIKQLSDGVNLAEDSPTYQLRDWAIKRAMTKQGHYLNEKHSNFALCIKSWNAYITGTPMKRLTFRRGGAKPEAFPEMYDAENNALKFPSENGDDGPGQG